MNLSDLENFLKENFDLTVPDSAVNGIQIANSDSLKPINKIITAVDASIATIEEVIDKKGDVLIVHHGIYWGKLPPLTGRYYRLVKKCMEHDIALIGLHLPLDLDQKLGNNIALLHALGFDFTKTFGHYKGLEILFQGVRTPALSNFEALVDLFEKKMGRPLHIIKSHSRPIEKIGVCSGGGLFGISDAVAEDCDTFITGDINHTVHHQVKEEGINLIAGGHYQTEILGVRKLGELLSRKFEVEHEFVDLPTNL